jgi:hypothetical protein
MSKAGEGIRMVDEGSVRYRCVAPLVQGFELRPLLTASFPSTVSSSRTTSTSKARAALPSRECASAVEGRESGEDQTVSKSDRRAIVVEMMFDFRPFIVRAGERDLVIQIST